ncbi:response regulator transcription factor [Marinobacterium arenosum]|uniref:response regulator transcription factor n=1 Tax=Marinobacterium arenosum TaxID=2862496 RepID=UPI001C987272|nr:response regulator transcription factor [Marinobacterium arenosum]MBY4677664.1 response regulator transcription factor [Marinobacterium arenosum]
MLLNRDVLVVEDDDANRYLCETLLLKEGYQVQAVTNIADACTSLKARTYDLVILDLNLPDGDGLTLARQYCHPDSLPFLIMTTRGAAQERYLGFEAGATDYLIKPFHPGELIYRVQHLMRKSGKQEVQDRLQFGDWTLDIVERTLADQAGNPVNLTRGEFDLLAALASSRGRVLGRDSLLEAITGDTSNGHPRTVDVLISRLRKKIESDPGQPRHILTVPGLGYRLENLS